MKSQREQAVDRATNFLTEAKVICDKGHRLPSKKMHSLCKKYGTSTGYFGSLVKRGHIYKKGKSLYVFNFNPEKSRRLISEMIGHQSAEIARKYSDRNRQGIKKRTKLRPSSGDYTLCVECGNKNGGYHNPKWRTCRDCWDKKTDKEPGDVNLVGWVSKRKEITNNALPQKDLFTPINSAEDKLNKRIKSAINLLKANGYGIVKQVTSWEKI